MGKPVRSAVQPTHMFWLMALWFADVVEERRINNACRKAVLIQ